MVAVVGGISPHLTGSSKMDPPNQQFTNRRFGDSEGSYSAVYLGTAPVDDGYFKTD